MRVRTCFIAVLSMICLTGCGSIETLDPFKPNFQIQRRGYQPINPIPVVVDMRNLTAEPNSSLLSSLPNESVRIAAAELDETGILSFGPITTGYEGKTYVVVLDYIKYRVDSIPVRDEIRRDDSRFFDNGQWFSDAAGSYDLLVEGPTYPVQFRQGGWSPNPADPGQSDVAPPLPSSGREWEDGFEIPVPTYIGVGLRVQAIVQVKSGKVDLGSLYGLGVAASQDRISGTLLIQTLGITGEPISALIPLPSEISVPTIQNAIQAVASIKSKMYEQDVQITPQTVSVENYLQSPAALDRIIVTLHMARGMQLDEKQESRSTDEEPRPRDDSESDSAATRSTQPKT